MALKPSPYQLDIFKNIEETKNSLIVEAVAGSGKTTTITGAVKLIDSNLRTLFCAFNASIAKELKNKLPDHVDSRTLNSLGHRAWQRHVGGRIELNVNKTYDILDSEEILKNHPRWEVRSVRFVVNQLVGYAKQMGLVPHDVVESMGAIPLIPDSKQAWMDIIDHFNIDFFVKRDGKTRVEIRKEIERKQNLAISLTRKVLTLGIQQKNVIDFNDQLYLPVIFNVEFAKYHVIFVDEAQDISMIQRVMIQRSLRKGGRVIAVGDPAQAIYGFRGADSKSLFNIAKEFDCKSLPLSICYRCGKNIVAEAQQYVSHIEAFDNAPDGTVERLGTYGAHNIDIFQKDVFVLCRNVAPLVKLAFELIKFNKPVSILGKNIGKNIANLINSLNPTTIPDLLKKLVKWEEIEIERLRERDPEASGDFIKERSDSVRTFIKCSGENSIPGLLESIDKLFSDKTKGVVLLSTIHKSKGLEADKVIILDFDLLPSKYAVLPWQKEQEKNLTYVAITRAKDYLGYIETPKDDS